METCKKKRVHILLLCLINVGILILSLFLTPIGDDWGYTTTPQINAEFAMSARPMDTLFGLLLGKMPSAFPFLNHFAVVAAHCISGIVLYLIATKLLEINSKCAFLFSIVFAISSTCCATVFSIDSVNQSLSLCFGVIGIYAYMLLSQNAVVKTVVYLIFSILATFSKECGIIFFFVIPLFDLQTKGLKATWKHILVNYILGGAFCLYFVQVVRSSKGIGAISIVNIIKNTIFHIGFSSVQFDTVSLLGYNSIAVPILTAVLSLPLLVLILKTLIQNLIKKDRFILFFAVLIAVSTFPQNLLSGAQEMNSYPTIFFMMLFFAYLCKEWDKKKMYCVLAPYVAAALICGGIKYHAMYKLSIESQAILNDIEAKTNHLSPERIKVYPINVFNEDSYGVFVLSPSGTIGYGHAVRDIYGYDKYVDVNYYHNKTDKTPLGSTNSTLIDLPDEEFLEAITALARDEIENNRFDLCLIIDPDCNVFVVN